MFILKFKDKGTSPKIYKLNWLILLLFRLT